MGWDYPLPHKGVGTNVQLKKAIVLATQATAGDPALSPKQKEGGSTELVPWGSAGGGEKTSVYERALDLYPVRRGGLVCQGGSHQGVRLAEFSQG